MQIHFDFNGTKCSYVFCNGDDIIHIGDDEIPEEGNNFVKTYEVMIKALEYLEHTAMTWVAKSGTSDFILENQNIYVFTWLADKNYSGGYSRYVKKAREIIGKIKAAGAYMGYNVIPGSQNLAKKRLKTICKNSIIKCGEL